MRALRLAVALALVLGLSGCRSAPPSRPPPPPPEAPATLRLCAWNIKKLGHGSKKDHALVAKILESECDAAALVEVMQKGGGHPGYDALLDALGPGWAGHVTARPRPNTGAGHAEFYAVVHRAGALRLCEEQAGLRFVGDHDGGAAGQGEDRFDREPAFACFVFEGPGGALDFLLGAFHACWGDRAEISAEVSALRGAVEQMLASRPGERDLVVLGDFNLVPEDLDAAGTGLVRLTEGSGSTLNRHGERTENLYDHVLALSPEATPELAARAEVLDVLGAAASAERFYSTVSDHLPVRVVLTLRGPDDD